MDNPSIQLSEEDQSDLLLGKDPKSIPAIAGNFGITFQQRELVQRYVSLSRESFRPYFIASDYIKKSIQSYKQSPTSDGEFIVPLSGGKYKIIFQERGGIQYGEYFENINALADYIIDGLYKKFELDRE